MGSEAWKLENCLRNCGAERKSHKSARAGRGQQPKWEIPIKINDSTRQGRIELKAGATVAVIGGGPAGAFFAIHLLRMARELKKDLKVIIFERRRSTGFHTAPCLAEVWKGCNYCAGGISPRLNDVLKGLGLKLPEEIIQSRIHSISIQGSWKIIELEVPAGREMLTVYRGSRPARRFDRYHNFDSFLLEEARKAGADVINDEVVDVQYAESGKPLVHCRVGEAETRLEADLAVFAAGVNERAGIPVDRSRILQSLQRLIPGFVPPRLRRAMIIELEAKPSVPGNLAGRIHFVEYGSKTVRLEMCSLVPKRGFVTAVLVGASVDAAANPAERQEVMRRFLELPHVRKLVSPGTQFSPTCVCSPNMVVGSARNPFGAYGRRGSK